MNIHKIYSYLWRFFGNRERRMKFFFDIVVNPKIRCCDKPINILDIGGGYMVVGKFFKIHNS